MLASTSPSSVNYLPQQQQHYHHRQQQQQQHMNAMMDQEQHLLLPSLKKDGGNFDQLVPSWSSSLTSSAFSTCINQNLPQRTLLEPSLSSEVLQSHAPHAFSPNCFEIFKLSLNSAPSFSTTNATSSSTTEQQPAAMKSFAPSTSSSRNSPEIKVATCIKPFLEAPQEYSVKSILCGSYSNAKSALMTNPTATTTTTCTSYNNVSPPPPTISNTTPNSYLSYTNPINYSPHIPTRVTPTSSSSMIVSKSSEANNPQNCQMAMYNMPYTYSAAQRGQAQTFFQRTQSPPSESSSFEEDRAFRMKRPLFVQRSSNPSVFDEKSGMLRPNLSKIQKSSNYSKRRSTSPKSDDEDKKKYNTGTWSKYEHDMFLKGLDEVGKNWKIISESYVTTRKRTQIASHAQKYFLKMAQMKKGETVSPYDLYLE
ncbi:hypothetical protein FDP41_004430 [Naegleria fowleri]|uniref:Uncharacterized protein n=1 Tax=Naegleria fowleri TaxID=5763 RepID=A0A6A5BQL0_NAEFO|nr:uncharacterized protein FDP41_004430 [Naegleria fowleri]KAF0976531.1 hypothetical protein FDP41_004430 [Naegleria fowleri]